MNVRIFWVRAMKCMCAQTKPRFILSSERVLGGMEFEPMLTPREKIPSTGKFPQRRIEPATLWTDPPLWTPLCSTRSHISQPRLPLNDRWSFRPAGEKSPGMDGIPAEIFKTAGPAALEALHPLLTSIWEEEDVPKEFRNATFVSLFKNRGSKMDCSNYPDISLLSVAGKILARVILNRLITKHLRRKPAGSPVWIPPKPQHHRHGLCTPGAKVHRTEYGPRCRIIDLTKAFDTVNREALWVILSKLGCPTKFVNLIRQFHEDVTGQVVSDCEASEPFSISNGVKQGCVLTPVLFNMFFTCVLSHAIREFEQGVCLRYRLDGSLFDLRQITAKTKTVEKTVLEALFADACALMAHRESDFQIIVNKFAEASRLFGLTIGRGETEVLFQSAPAAVEHRPTISIDGTQLKTVDDFKYLGSVISSDGSLDKEISARICKASQALGRLKAHVLNQHNIRQSTKLKVYRAVVLTSLLYGCDWDMDPVQKTPMRSLRSIPNIKWQDRVSNL